MIKCGQQAILKKSAHTTTIRENNNEAITYITRLLDFGFRFHKETHRLQVALLGSPVKRCESILIKGEKGITLLPPKPEEEKY